MQACVCVEQGKRVYPSLLLTGLRSPARGRLLKLGGLYLLATVIAIAATSLIDNAVLWKTLSGQIKLDEKIIQQSHLSQELLLAMVVYTPAAMAFWYAAPLIAWKNMGIGKALFYSLFAVWRAGKAFLVYGAVWLIIWIFVPMGASIVIAALINKVEVVTILLLPLLIVMSVIACCSFYPTYTHIFGRPASMPADS